MRSIITILIALAVLFALFIVLPRWIGTGVLIVLFALWFMGMFFSDDEGGES